MNVLEILLVLWLGLGGLACVGFVLVKALNKEVTITVTHNHHHVASDIPQGSPILEQPEPLDEKDRPTVNMDPFMEALQDIMLGGDDNVRER